LLFFFGGVWLVGGGSGALVASPDLAAEPSPDEGAAAVAPAPAAGGFCRASGLVSRAVVSLTVCTETSEVVAAVEAERAAGTLNGIVGRLGAIAGVPDFAAARVSGLCLNIPNT
jgi:hypothetical protein